MPYEEYYTQILIISLFSTVVLAAIAKDTNWLFKKPVTLGKILIISLLAVIAFFAIPVLILFAIFAAIIYIADKILTFPLIK